jgi:hypothetical protein
MTKAIKNVSDETWREFKALAGLKNMTLGEYFEEMVKASKKTDAGGSYWKKLLEISRDPIIKDKEKTKKRVAQMRKDFVMRDVRTGFKHNN